MTSPVLADCRGSARLPHSGPLRTLRPMGSGNGQPWSGTWMESISPGALLLVDRATIRDSKPGRGHQAAWVPARRTDRGAAHGPGLFGYLELAVLFYVARGLKLPPSRVYGVATFYHLFRSNRRASTPASSAWAPPASSKGPTIARRGRRRLPASRRARRRRTGKLSLRRPAASALAASPRSWSTTGDGRRSARGGRERAEGVASNGSNGTERTGGDGAPVVEAVRLHCCTASGCLAADGRAVKKALRPGVADRGVGDRVQVVGVGCLGPVRPRARSSPSTPGGQPLRAGDARRTPRRSSPPSTAGRRRRASCDQRHPFFHLANEDCLRNERQDRLGADRGVRRDRRLPGAGEGAGSR